LVDPEPDDVKRASAVNARIKADAYARKLREKPFWRFRRRRALNKALVRAERREQDALRALDDYGD
jgi:hypothetical protein